MQGQLLLSLVVELANEQQTEVIRQQAGLYIKVQLSAEEESIRAQKLHQWQVLDDNIKNQIKAGTTQVNHQPQYRLSCLRCKLHNVRSTNGYTFLHSVHTTG